MARKAEMKETEMVDVKDNTAGVPNVEPPVEDHVPPDHVPPVKDHGMRRRPPAILTGSSIATGVSPPQDEQQQKKRDRPSTLLAGSVSRHAYAEALFVHVTHCQASEASVQEMLHALYIAIEQNDTESRDRYLHAMSSLLFILRDVDRLMDTMLQVHASKCRSQGRPLDGKEAFEKLQYVPQIESTGAACVIRKVINFLLTQGFPQEALNLLEYASEVTDIPISETSCIRIRCAVALWNTELAWSYLPQEIPIEWLDAVMQLLILKGSAPGDREDTHRVAVACWAQCQTADTISCEVLGSLSDVFMLLGDYDLASSCAMRQLTTSRTAALPFHSVHAHQVAAECHFRGERIQEALRDANKQLEVCVTRGYDAHGAHRMLALVYTRLGAVELGHVHSTMYAASAECRDRNLALSFYIQYAQELSKSMLRQRAIEAAVAALSYCPADDIIRMCVIKNMLARLYVATAGVVTTQVGRLAVVQMAINACFDYKAAATKAKCRDDVAHASALLGMAYVHCKQYRKSVRCLMDCIGELDQMAAAHGALGQSYLQLKKFDSSMEHFERQVSLGRDQTDDVNITQGLEGLGDLALERRDWDHALAYYSEELSILNNPRDQSELFLSSTFAPSSGFAEYQAYRKLGETYRRMGRLDTCVTYYQQCLSIASTVPALSQYVYAVNGDLGKIHMERYDYEAAYQCIDAAMKGAHSSADKESHASFLATMCQAAFLMRDWDKCIRSSMALEEVATAEDHKVLSITLRGSCLVELGRMKQASDLVDELRKLVLEKSASETVSHSVMCSALHTISSVLCWGQRYKEALPVYQQWISLSEQRKDDVGALDHIKANFGHSNCHFFLLVHNAAFLEYSKVMDLVDAYIERSLETLASERTIRQLNVFACQAIHWVMATRWEVRSTQVVDEIWTRNRALHRYFQHYHCRTLMQTRLSDVLSSAPPLNRKHCIVIYSATHEENIFRIVVQGCDGITNSRASLRTPVLSAVWESAALSARVLRALYDALWAPILSFLPSFGSSMDSIVICPDTQLFCVPFQTLLSPRGKYVIHSHPPIVVCPSPAFLRIGGMIAPMQGLGTDVARLSCDVTTRKELLTVLSTRTTVVVEGRTTTKCSSVHGAVWSGSITLADGTVQAHEINQRGAHMAQLILLRPCTFDISEVEIGRVPLPLAFLASGSRNVLCAIAPMAADAIAKSSTLMNEFLATLDFLQSKGTRDGQVALAWYLVCRAALKRKVPPNIVASIALLGLP